MTLRFVSLLRCNFRFGRMPCAQSGITRHGIPADK